MLKKSIISLTSIALLTGCSSEFDKAPEIQFNDTILRHSYNLDYGVAVGLLNIYVMYGKFKLQDKSVPAGICLTPQGFRKFSIRSILNKYPELVSDESEEAARRQDFKRL